MAVIIYVSESATPTVRGKITAKTHPPCPLAAARGCVMPADPAGHGGCRLCRLAGHRIGQYAHLQQCARLVILALILGRETVDSASGPASPVLTGYGHRVGSLGPGLTSESADAVRAVLRDDLSAGPQVYRHPPAVPA
jgi:hypothetical protein